MCRKILVSLFVFFMVFLPDLSPASTQSEALVSEGRQLLFKNGNPTYQGIIDANEKFKAAVEADGTDQTANLFYALTRVASFVLKTSDGTSFQTIADIIQAMGIPIRLNELIENDSPFGEVPELDGRYSPPSGTLPNGDDLRNVLSPGLVGVINGALANLDKIGVNINFKLTGTETGNLTDTEVDYTDVLLIKGFLNAFKTVVLIVSAYDLDGADIRELVALGNSGMMDLHPNMMTQLFGKYPDLLKLAADGATLLSEAKAALQTASDRLSDAYASLANELLDETDNQDDDLFCYESEGDEQEFENLLNVFSELLDSMAENRPATVQDISATWEVVFNNNDDFMVTLEGDIFGNGSIDREDSYFQGEIDENPIGGWIPYWKITGNNFKAILIYRDDKRIVLTGVLNSEGTSISNGICSYQVYDGYGYTETSTGLFSANRLSQQSGELNRLDLNALFGNAEIGTVKAPLDIRTFLPQFDALGEPIAGTFPEPVFNGLFPDYATDEIISGEVEFDAPYKVYTIPEITSDIAAGAPSNWTQCLVNTDSEDDYAPGMDILNTYLAKDGDYLYMAMELAGAPIAPAQGEGESVNYQFEIMKKKYEWYRNALRFNAWYNQYDGSGWSVEVSRMDAYGTYQHIANLDSDHVSVGTSYIKWKVPLANLNALETYGGSWISCGTWSPGINDGDWVEGSRLAPVYTVQGAVSVPDGYTGGKIYFYLTDTEYPSRKDDFLVGTYIESTSDGSFTLTDAPYSSESLYLHVLWDTDGNGIPSSGDYSAMTSFNIQNNVVIPDGTLEPKLLEINSLPIEGVSVKSVHSGDNQFNTYFDVFIGQEFSGVLPYDIDTITIRYPDGSIHQMYPNGEGNFEYYADWREFSFILQGSPQLGEYVFTVTGKDGSVGIKSDTQKDLITIPIVDVNSLKINTGSKTPIVSWAPVSAPGTGITYRLDLKPADGEFLPNGTSLFQTRRDWDMTSCALPLLEPGKQYQYRIRAMDDSDWIQVDNRSQTEWIAFTMDNILTHAAVPALDLDAWGVVKYSHVGAIPGMDFEIKIIDHDGVSYDGSSHQVSARPIDAAGNTIGDGIINLTFDSSENGIQGSYYGWLDAEYLPVGTAGAKFFVVDPDGTQTTLTDVITGPDMVPPTDIQLACAADGTTPTFTWAAVGGANRYRIRIYDENKTNTIWRGNVTNVTSYTLPPGVLNPETTYQYRLEARDGHWGYFDTDQNIIFPPRDASGNYPKFTTGTRTDKPFIVADSSGVQTWSDDYRGTITNFWVQIYDAQGAPGNIQSVKVIHPDGTTETDLYYEYSESDICAVYSNEAYEMPQAGTYTFVVRDKDGNQYSLAEDLTVNPMRYPAASSLSVVVSGTGAVFDWDDVTCEDGTAPAFYQLEIYNKHHERIFKFVTTESQYSLAPGFLEKGELYGFRVTTRDKFWDQNTDNGSSSPWSFYRAVNFKTEPVMNMGSHQPGIDTNNFGAALIHLKHPVTGAPSYWLQFSVKVTDEDGVPENIKSVTVQGPGITGSLNLNYYSSEEGNTAEYRNDIIYDTYTNVPEGLYTFTVEDENGNTATTTDILVKKEVPQVSYLTPAEGTFVSSGQPVITWNDPEGTPCFYKVRIYQHWNKLVHQSGILDTGTYIIPAGILKPGEMYGYQIHAYDTDPRTTDVDNVSINQVFFAKQNHFTVMEVSPLLDLQDALNVLDVISGGSPAIQSLGADVNKDGRLNLQDAVPILQGAIK